MNLQLFRVIVPVSDIEKACAFYAIVFAQPGRRVSKGRHYFDCGQTILACFSPREDGDPWEATPNPDHVYFSVSDLDLALQRCGEAGAPILEEIAVRPWGERSFYAADPFGNKFCFVDSGTVFRG